MDINQRFKYFLTEQSIVFKEISYDEGYLYQGRLQISDTRLVDFIISLQREEELADSGIYQIIYHDILWETNENDRYDLLSFVNQLNDSSAGAYYFCLTLDNKLFARHVGKIHNDFQMLLDILVSGGPVVQNAIEQYESQFLQLSSNQIKEDLVSEKEDLNISSSQDIAQIFVPTGDKSAQQRLIDLRQRLGELEERLPKEKQLLAELHAKFKRTQAAYEAELAFRQVEEWSKNNSEASAYYFQSPIENMHEETTLSEDVKKKIVEHATIKDIDMDMFKRLIE